MLAYSYATGMFKISWRWGVLTIFFKATHFKMPDAKEMDSFDININEA